MQTGFLLGIVAAFFWALSNMVDKYLVDRYAPRGNIGGILLFSCLFPVFLALVALFMSTGITKLPSTDILILILSGVFWVGILFFYLKALAEDDASVVMTLLVMAPLFSLIISLVILGEWPTNIQLVGGAFMVMGALTVSYQPSQRSFKWRLIFYAVAACVCIGLVGSLFKFSTVAEQFWDSIFWRSIGMIATGVVLYITMYSFRRDLHIFLKEHFRAGITLNTTNETLTLIGDTIFAFAILFTPLALVQTTEAYQPIFILIGVFLLSQMGFTYIKESYERRQLQLKILGIVLVLIGSVILSI